MHHRCRSLVFRSWTLRKMEYPLLLDICKNCLIINYLGQGAWLLKNYKGKLISCEMIESGFNPFYGVMPHWFLYFGIAIATAAAIIASQALISGSFTLDQ